MIGKLQYYVPRKLDITLVVGIVTRLYTNPRENHMMTMKY